MNRPHNIAPHPHPNQRVRNKVADGPKDNLVLPKEPTACIRLGCNVDDMDAAVFLGAKIIPCTRLYTNGNWCLLKCLLHLGKVLQCGQTRGTTWCNKRIACDCNMASTQRDIESIHSFDFGNGANHCGRCCCQRLPQPSVQTGCITNANDQLEHATKLRRNTARWLLTAG